MEREAVRSTVLELLSWLYVPTSPEDLSLCAEVSIRMHIAQEVIADQPHRDFELFSAGAGQSVWICPALDYPDGSADYDYLTRSNWSVQSRLVDGGLSEAQELILLRNLCDMLVIAEEKEMLIMGFAGSGEELTS